MTAVVDEYLSNLHKDLLIIDPDKNNLIVEEGIFESRGIKTVTASSLARTLELLYKHTPKVVVTDFLPNDVDDIHLLRSIKKLHSETLIILRTDSSARNLDYIKKYDLVHKIISDTTTFETLFGYVKEAIKFHGEQDRKLHFTDKSKDWLKEELEWLLWKEEKNQHSQSSYGRKIMETIVHSIFQGMGVGSLLTLIDMMELEIQEEDGLCKISKATVNALIKNSETVRIVKEKLDNVIHVFDIEYPKELLKGEEIQGIIERAIEEIEPFRKIKKNMIKVDNIHSKTDFYGNRNLLNLAIKELLINAFKYSPEKAKIYISVLHYENEISIAILNPILSMPGGISGIPKEIEHKIFEPFFKINNVYDERFFQEDIGFGVGLSVIQKGITEVGGKIHIYETIDHITEAKPVKKILAEMVLPAAEN